MKGASIRELEISIGKYPTGPNNNITDVKGIKVGHTTLIEGDHIRTGVTSILPSSQIFNNKFIAGSFILNGAGEVSGLTQLTEWGLLETPIALTNTMSVGTVTQGLTQWMSKKYVKIWNFRDVVIPVVGECDDSYLNDCMTFPITPDHVVESINNATSGVIPQGSIGAGTGMICCDVKGGIGSSSREIEIEGKIYTIGVLVLSNFGEIEDLKLDGLPVGRVLKKEVSQYRLRRENYGSIITVIATDLPTSSHQISRLCKRAALGIGRVGSYAAHGSGEIILGFTTANVIKHRENKPHYKLNVILDDHLNSAYRAVIEATEEAIWNSLTYSGDMAGADGRVVPGVNLAKVKKIYSKIKKLERELEKS
ncbi:aminopeptidase [Desulfoluna limicola]|uniref:Aminopeptidase n=2 Tax=Desulfoluna limicola TaxID=2810562 RepID=A0ABN6EZ29_9BACT|nr:aminopeptidase [Desulfoluna limicola]